MSENHPAIAPAIIEQLANQLRLALGGEAPDVHVSQQLVQRFPSLQDLVQLIHEVSEQAQRHKQDDDPEAPALHVEPSRLLEQAQAMARASEAHARAVLDMALESIVTIDDQGIIQFFNPASERLFGYQAREVLGRNVHCLMPEPYRSAHDGYLRRYLETREPHVIGIGRAIVAQRKDGSVFPAELAVNAYRVDERTFFVGTLHDISRHVAEEHHLRHAATHDPLTGLLNRHGLLEALRQALEESARNQSGVGVIYVDLDRFKPVNDTLGHAAGDECLRAVAQRLAHAVQAGDIIARLGGDEFVVAVRDLREALVLDRVAARIQQVLAAPFDLLQGQQVRLGASLGLALSPRDGASVEDLLHAADQAMYASKQAGR
ncbi:MAG: diguanylate cyclase domain-containing protein [Pseudomonadota bacterium]